MTRDETINLVSPEPHPLAGQAKDVAAGAVLLAAHFAAVVGGCVFLPRIWACWSYSTGGESAFDAFTRKFSATSCVPLSAV